MNLTSCRLLSRMRLAVLFTFLVTGTSYTSSANEQLEIEKSTPEASQTDLITNRVEKYVDEYFPNFLEKNHIPGAAFILVDKNGPLLIKGYGEHSFENGVAIQPDKHLFRIASITKTMTGLGVMKLVNEGKIDLDTDVNEYFTRFQIPDTFEQPITVRHLLQHNSGISDEFVGLSFTDISERRSMGDFLEEHVPQRFFPPGKYGSYTNRAFMLLGHMIEEVSGEPYEDWMSTHVFLPLGMKNTGFSLSEQQKPWFTVGSFYNDGEYQKQESVDTISRPSGDAISTATDMGRYASMLLNNGVIEGKVFLEKETVQQIFSDCFAHHEIFEKACLSFARTLLPDNTVRLQHSGHYGGWYSDFAFFPELGVGYFINTNGDTSFVKEFRQGIAEQITGHNFDAKINYQFADSIDRSDKLVGNYRTQFISSTFEKIYHLVVGDDVVALKNDATLIFKGAEFKQIEPLIFRNLKTGTALVFEQDEQGNVVRFLTPTDWFSIGEKLSNWQTAEFQKNWLNYALILCALIAVLLLILIANTANQQKLMLSFVLLINLLWLSPITILWLTNTTDLMAITLGLTLPMKAAMMLVNIAVICTLIFAVLVIVKLCSAAEGFYRKTLVVITLINSVGLIYWANYWNLIGA